MNFLFASFAQYKARCVPFFMYCDLRRLQIQGSERVPDSRQVVPQMIQGGSRRLALRFLSWVLADRQSKREGHAPVRVALDSDSAAVLGEDLVRDGEP